VYTYAHRTTNSIKITTVPITGHIYESFIGKNPAFDTSSVPMVTEVPIDVHVTTDTEIPGSGVVSKLLVTELWLTTVGLWSSPPTTDVELGR